MRRGKRLSAFNTNLSVTRRKANGVKAPLLQQEWGCCKVESLQGACKDFEWHRRDVCVCVCVCVRAAQVSFSLFFGRKLLLALPGLAAPTRSFSSSSRTLLPAQLRSLLTSQPLLAISQSSLSPSLNPRAVGAT